MTTKKSISALLLSQIIRDASAKVRKNLLRRDAETPWMRHREIDLIVDVIAGLQPATCLEWGAGTGTRYFAEFIPAYARWLSVEHDEKWARLVAGKIQNPNVSVVFKGPNSEPVPGTYTSGVYTAANDGTYEDFQDYIDYPEEHGPFDLILVDGRARSQCVEKSKVLLSDGGVVMLHDANRTYYYPALQGFRQSAFFVDHRGNAGGLWIGTNGARELSDVIDVERQRRLWSLYEKIGRFVGV